MDNNMPRKKLSFAEGWVKLHPKYQAVAVVNALTFFLFAATGSGFVFFLFLVSVAAHVYIIKYKMKKTVSSKFVTSNAMPHTGGPSLKDV